MERSLHKYKITVAYEGTRYSGWQIQPNAPTIQETLERAITTIVKHPVRVIGSGRTDAGVHALEQVAHFSCPEQPDLLRFHTSINGLIPADIRVHTLEPTPDSFHARYSALGKIYHYHLYLDKIMDPFRRHTTVHVYRQLDLNVLQEAASLFVGKHDFTSFSNEAHSGSAARNPVRTIKRLDVIPEKGGVRLEFEGDGFLYKMVRNIVGMLMEVSSGKRPLSAISETFQAKDRRQSGRAAPARGLFLVKVFYEV